MSERTRNEIIDTKTVSGVPLLKFSFSLPSLNNGPDMGIIFIDGRIAAAEIVTEKGLPYRIGNRQNGDDCKQVNAWAETRLDLRYTSAPDGTTADVEVLTVNEWKENNWPVEKVVDGIKKTIYEYKPSGNPVKYNVYLIKNVHFVNH